MLNKQNNFIFVAIINLLEGIRQELGNQKNSLNYPYRMPKFVGVFLFNLCVMASAQANIPRTNFGKLQPIPISIIAEANELNQFSVLHTWITLKQLFKRNTVIYNLNYETLYNRTGISHTTLRKHIKILFDKKLVKWTKNGHLIIKAINKIKKHKYETTVLVPVRKNRADQILMLRKVILHRNIENQKEQISKRREILNNCDSTTYKFSRAQRKLVKKYGGEQQHENSFQSVTTLSNKSIGKLFYKTNGRFLSQITGHRIQKKLRQANQILTKVRLVKVSEFECKYSPKELVGLIRNKSNNNLFVRLSNEITMVKQ